VVLTLSSLSESVKSTLHPPEMDSKWTVSEETGLEEEQRCRIVYLMRRQFRASGKAVRASAPALP
jgi:hypothetical protein